MFCRSIFTEVAEGSSQQASLFLAFKSLFFSAGLMTLLNAFCSSQNNQHFSEEIMRHLLSGLTPACLSLQKKKGHFFWRNDEAFVVRQGGPGGHATSSEKKHFLFEEIRRRHVFSWTCNNMQRKVAHPPNCFWKKWQQATLLLKNKLYVSEVMKC